MNKCITQDVLTNKGHCYKADIVLQCTGLTPNTDIAKEILGEGAIDANGRIKVNSQLRVVNTKNVYAIGDCCNTREEKMAAHAEAHGTLVAKNIYREMQLNERVNYSQGILCFRVSVIKIQVMATFQNSLGCC